MNIIIAGAGGVGTHLAKLLSREKQDIILIDEDARKLADLESNFDLMTVARSPTSIEALKEIEIGKADLVIGVMPDEARNMTLCMLASKLGARRTVARVDNYEYTNPEYKKFFQSVGINSLIYPEVLAAQEIITSLKRSWIRMWWEVHDRKLILVGIKVRESASILNQPLSVIGGEDSLFHVVAIKRGNETIIPHGSDCLQPFDIVYFMTLKENIQSLREKVGKTDYPEVKNVMLMGADDTAEHVARLFPNDMHLKIIEQNEERCLQLSKNIDKKNVLIIHGDGRDMALLEEEGIQHTQAFVSLTGNAEENILSCLAAKRLGVKKTVAMVENMDYANMAESLDIGTVINKKAIAASRIYQMLIDADVTNVKCLTVANADVAEFVVKDGAKITRKPVKDLDLPDSMTLGGVVRGDQAFLVNGNTKILAGDHVVAFCLTNTIKKIEKLFH